MDDSQLVPVESSSGAVQPGKPSVHHFQLFMKWGSDLREFIALLVFVGTIVGIEHSRPTVEVSVKSQDYPAPVHTAALQAKVQSEFRSAQKQSDESSTPVRSAAAKSAGPIKCEHDRPCAEKLFEAIERFANAFQEVTYLRIRNLSNDAIENVDLRVEGLQSLVDYGVRSDSSEITDLFVKSAADFAVHDQDSQSVLFKGLKVLPPRSSTEVVIWGELGGNGPSIKCPSGPRCQVVTTEIATGVEAIVVRNLGPIVAVLLTGTFVIGLTRSRRRAT